MICIIYFLAQGGVPLNSAVRVHKGVIRMKLADVPIYYDSAASRYDKRLKFWFGNVLRIESYRLRAVESLGEIEGSTVLDIGCGAGANFPLLVPRVGEQGRIIGIDYSEGMLEKARDKITNNSWNNIELYRDDASVIKNVDSPVDAIISTYCLGIVHDIENALNRAVGLLKPGGKMAILDFQRVYPEKGPIKYIFPVYRKLLQYYSIDSPEDLDNENLQKRWEIGESFLQNSLKDLSVQRFLFGMGIFITGRKE